MKINTTPDYNRVNPAELRFLRSAVDATDTGCKDSAIQAVVTYAKLHDGMDLKAEAKYLRREMEAQAEARQLHIA